MAYDFTSFTTDAIACGTGLTHAATCSVAVRLTLNDDPDAHCLRYGDASTLFNCFLDLTAAGHVIWGFSKASGTAFPFTQWSSAGVLTTVVGTYDGAALRLYGGTDATAKATTAESGTPDQGGTQTFTIGRDSGTTAPGARIFEAAYWPGVVLTGAQAAILGGAGPATGVPTPSNYWPLVSDATDLFGSAHGTVTGATLFADAQTKWFSTTPAVGKGRGLLLGVG